jgi:hypothetical protein
MRLIAVCLFILKKIIVFVISNYIINSLPAYSVTNYCCEVSLWVSLGHKNIGVVVMV